MFFDHQLLHWNYCSYDRAEQDDGYESRLAYELLHHTLILGRTNSYSFNDLPKYCRADQKVDSHCCQFYCLGYR